MKDDSRGSESYTAQQQTQQIQISVGHFGGSPGKAPNFITISVYKYMYTTLCVTLKTSLGTLVVK